MESLIFPEANLTEFQSCDEPDFRCRAARVTRLDEATVTVPFRIVSIAKVADGVTYRSVRLPNFPPFPDLKTQCVTYGDFCPRPYTLAQESDACSRVCALALFQAYCVSAKLDLRAVMTRAYPYDKGSWESERWERIREDSNWQGTSYPQAWNPETLPDLLLSLRVSNFG